jgi:hypothetical protein
MNIHTGLVTQGAEPSLGATLRVGDCELRVGQGGETGQGAVCRCLVVQSLTRGPIFLMVWCGRAEQ